MGNPIMSITNFQIRNQLCRLLFLITALSISLPGIGQTISIDGNQYAFSYSGVTNSEPKTGFGLYFNQNNPAPARYEFKNNVGTTVWSTEASTGRTWSAGNIFTDGDMVPSGNLRPGGALQVEADKYAFQYYAGGNPTNYGLFFSLTNTSYEFKTGDGTNYS